MGMFKNMIAMWSGTLGTVPANWQLCDGTNGTPQLEQFFIRGSQGSYSIGDTGGNATHSHAFTTNGHYHRLEDNSGLVAGPDYHDYTDTVQVTGTTNAADNNPPWYSLAFIMRLT